MANRSIFRALILCLVGTLALPPSFAQKAAMMMSIKSVLTPDFQGKTLQQVHAAEVSSSGRPMFIEIQPQGPTDGVVYWQSPQPKTPIIPGKTRLSVRLRPTILQQFVGALIQSNPKKPMTQVPGLFGLTRSAARAALEKARLKGHFTGEESGVVTWQSSPAGESVAQGSTVEVTVEFSRVVVPLLVGDTLSKARAQLASDALQLGKISGHPSASSIVQIQSIPAGSEVERNTAVNLMFIPARVKVPRKLQIVVPNLIGMDIETAVATLRKVGLSPHLLIRKSRWVSDQSPPPGQRVLPKTIVDISLQSPPPPPPPPSPPWWVRWIRRARPVLGFVLVIGLLGLGTGPTFALIGYLEKISELQKIRSRSLLPSDIHVVTSKTVPKFELKRKGGPALRVVLHIRERDSDARVSIKGEPEISRQEKSDACRN